MEGFNILLTDIVLTIVGIAIVFLMRWIAETIGVSNMKRIQEEIYAKKELANLAIRFVEQAYSHYKGEEKLEEACVWVTERAKEVGLYISPEEVEGLVEATLREAKEQFGTEWDKMTKKE